MVGAAEKNAACTAHGGSHDEEDWGGIPIVIWIGDDYQLPPPTRLFSDARKDSGLHSAL